MSRKEFRVGFENIKAFHQLSDPLAKLRFLERLVLSAGEDAEHPGCYSGPWSVVGAWLGEIRCELDMLLEGIKLPEDVN